MTRYTADMANRESTSDLDRRIELAVKDAKGGKSAYLRIYHDDPWCANIQEELESRGFTNVDVPAIILKGDVYFEWRVG